MSERIVSFSLSQRLLVVLSFLGVLFFGIASMIRLPIDAYPEVAPVQVKIILQASGMTPSEIESRVSIPVEQNMQSLPDKKLIRSLSKYGISDVTIDFEDGTDIYLARQLVSQRLAEVLDELPKSVSGGLAPITTPLGEALMFTIESDTLDLMQKRTLLDWVINKRIKAIDGVADTNSLGGLAKTYEVVPNLSKMKQYGISFSELATRLETNNQNDGLGRLSIGEQSLFVRSEGRLKTLQDINELVLRYEDGTYIRIKDIAQTRIGSLSRAGFVTKDGVEEAVKGLILTRKGENTSAVVERVKEELRKIEKDLPSGTTIDIFYDRSDLVSEAISTVSKALLEAAVLIFIILFLFLGNFRSSISVAIILPFAVMISFISMEYFGISANLMSLGGLAIALGMLIDAGVVMVENISSYLQDKNRQNLSKHEIVLEAAKEVASPIFTGVLIIIIVFLPLLTLDGLEGRLFVPMAMSIVFALSASLLLALTLIPVMSYFTLKKAPHAKTKLMQFLEAKYEKVLRFVLAYQKGIYVAVLVLWGVGIALYTQVGKSFMPELDEGSIIVGVEKNPSISLEASRDIDLKIAQAILREIPEVRSVVGRGGSDELGLDPMALNDTDTFMVLRPKEEWRVPSTPWLQDELRRVLDTFMGIEYSFTQPIEMRVSEMLSGSRGDIVVNIYGEDTQKLDDIAKEVYVLTNKIEGASDVYKKNNEGVAYWELHYNQEALSRYGIDKDELSRFVKSSMNGVQVGIIQEDLRRIPLIIKGSKAMQKSQHANEDIYYVLKDGSAVKLSQLVEFKRTLGPVEVNHENAMRKSLIQTNVVGRDLVSFVDELQQSIQENITLPQGYFVEFSGEYKNQQRASKRLGFIVPVSIAIIFLLLLMSFKSSMQASLVLLNIPFALIGGMIGLYLSGGYLNVPASVGFIALMGIAVLNGVVMLNYFNKLKKDGLEALDIVLQGSLSRLRPVLMTAMTTALGLIPLLYATGAGSEIQKPLAIVVINGLVSSTFLTLILLPILYHRFVLKQN